MKKTKQLETFSRHRLDVISSFLDRTNEGKVWFLLIEIDE